MEHGEHYIEDGKEYMNDHINGVDWHVPNKTELAVNEDGSWNDEEKEKYSWENQ